MRKGRNAQRQVNTGKNARATVYSLSDDVAVQDDKPHRGARVAAGKWRSLKYFNPASTEPWGRAARFIPWFGSSAPPDG